MSNTPTNAEAWDLWLESITGGHHPASLAKFARAVLAKWGTPTAGEPVAYRHMHDDGWEYYDAPTGSDCPGCEALCKCTQPVVREPLTPSQYNTALGCATDIPPSRYEAVTRAIERAHGITQKGGKA